MCYEKNVHLHCMAGQWYCHWLLALAALLLPEFQMPCKWQLCCTWHSHRTSRLQQAASGSLTSTNMQYVYCACNEQTENVCRARLYRGSVKINIPIEDRAWDQKLCQICLVSKGHSCFLNQMFHQGCDIWGDKQTQNTHKVCWLRMKYIVAENLNTIFEVFKSLSPIILHNFHH